MADYSRPEGMFRMLCRGMSFKPIDQLQPGEYGYLQNVRVIEEGRIDMRLGANRASTTSFGALVHSIRNLFDKVLNVARWVVGAGTSLFVDNGGPAIDTGYSGNPLSMVIWRPDQSVSPWMYVADSNKMSKVKVDGTLATWGLPQPQTAPVAQIAVGTPAQFGRQVHEVVPQITNPGTAWTLGGTASGITSVDRFSARQMLPAFPYPLGQPGSLSNAGMWCAAMVALSGGGTVQYVLIDNSGSGYFTMPSVVFSGGGGTGAAATAYGYEGQVTTIIVTNGGTGYTSPPTVSLSGIGTGAVAHATLSSASGPAIVGYPNVLPGSLLQLWTGTSSPTTQFCDVLVKQVITGTAASTVKSIQYGAGTTGLCTIVPAALPAQAAGNSSSFSNPDLAVATEAVAPGTILLIDSGASNQEYAPVQAVINGPDGTAAIVLNTTQSHGAGETIQFLPTVVFSSDVYANPTSGNVYAQAQAASVTVGAGTGTMSYYTTFKLTPQGPNGYGWKEQDYVAITVLVDNPAILSDVEVWIDIDASGNHDFQHNALYYVITSQALLDPTVAGQGQWQTYTFRFADMLRVGTDDASNLQTIYGLQVQVNAISSINVQVDSVIFFGGGAVDVGTAVNNYYYRYRYRNLNGSYSNWSPATRGGLSLQRNTGLITVPSSSYDKADIARFGGALTAWTYVGTTDASQNWQFVDNFADEAVAANPQAQLDDFQPFPDVDVPHSGTCNVNGNLVTWVSGQQFSTSWAPGSEMLINEVLYHLYAAPTSATLLEIVESGNAQTGVNFLLTEPTLMAQPLISVWGPDDQGVIFGCGSSYQPGVVFFTNPKAPDNASDKNQIELGSPTDPMVGGVLNAGRSIACSGTKWWALYPQLNAAGLYQPTELQVGKALYCRTGICSDGQTIAFLSDDGIYLTTGAQAQSITDPDLRDLFPHPTQTAVTIPNGPVLYPPDMTLLNSLRLAIADRLIFFDYVDLNRHQTNLVYDLRTGGWISRDLFGFGAFMHYGIEEWSTPGFPLGAGKTLIGCGDGYIRWYNSAGDENVVGSLSGIGARVNTLAYDAGDFRADKKWGDMVVDYECPAAATGITATPYYNNYSLFGAGDSLPPSSRTLSAPFDLSQQMARNLGISFVWNELNPVILYGWQPSYIAQPVNMGTTPSDWEDDGYLGAKWLQGCIIESDTGNVPRTIQVEGDNGAVGATVTVQQSGQGVQAYSWPPFITHLMRLAPTDAGDTWKNYKVQWIWEPEPELAQFWVTQGTDHDLQGFMHVKEVQIAHISTADITLSIQADAATITRIIPNSGGAYRKTYLILPPNKAKIYTYSLIASPGFRLFKKDCEVHVKQWGSTGPYIPFNPFGGPHRADGARI